MPSPALSYVVDLPLPRDSVWELWTDSVRLQGWLCERASVDLALGGAFVLEWSDAAVAGQVLSVDHPRLLVLSWPVAGLSSEVELRLLPTLSGTRVELTHSGLCGEQAERADRLWQRGLERLKSDWPGRRSAGVTSR